MVAFQTRVNRKSDAFAANRADMLALIDQLRTLEGRAEALSERRRPRFEERGQLTPRERLQRLLDPGMPFLELYNMANYLVGDEDPETSVPGASAISGIGFISGVRCMVVADDSGINAGAIQRMSVQKMNECADVAIAKKLPFVHLVESAGANLLDYRVELWAQGGGMFARLAWLSAAGIPTFTVLHGPSTAGGAYMPGMSDYVIGVKGRGRASLAGAALLRAATGEIADEEDLAGSEMHASVSGLVEYLAEDDAHALLIMRDLMAQLDWNAHCPRRDARRFKPPVHDIDDIAGIVPADYKIPYDVRELFARLADGSEFIEFKPRYGPATVCAQTEIFGFACGIIGNNGPIDPDGATKAAQFFQLCDQSHMPIVFLNNTTGYMVGRDYEHAGMIKHGSKMIQAVANVRVPRIALYIGASFGAGNYGMSGYGYEPDFLFAWPNARTGVMGGEQAARTMAQVVELAAKRRGQPLDEAALAAQSKQIVDHYERQEHAFFTSGLCLDQGVIDPRDTRKVLGFALETLWEARHRKLYPNSFGVARL